MDIESLNAMNEGLHHSLLTMIDVVVLVTTFITLAGFAIYLAGIAWSCFEDTRRSIPASSRARRTSPPNIWKSMPRVPTTQVRKTRGTSHAPIREASPTARSRF